jgi:hypothetical protein
MPVSTKLTKLAKIGLTVSPMCVPGRSWALTAEGRKLAHRDAPFIPDDTDKRILRALAWRPMKQLVLVREIEVCALTIKRRTAVLIERGLVRQDSPRAPFAITAKGRGALGDDAPVPWVRLEAIAASLAKDVASRSSPDVMGRAECSRIGGLARARQMFGLRGRSSHTSSVAAE